MATEAGAGKPRAASSIEAATTSQSIAGATSFLLGMEGSPATALTAAILHRGAGRNAHFAAGGTPHVAPYQERGPRLTPAPEDQPEKGDTLPDRPGEGHAHPFDRAMGALARLSRRKARASRAGHL